MEVGFTGTRLGMTNSQQVQFVIVMARLLGRFHHGGAREADTEAVSLLPRAYPSALEIVEYPIDSRGPLARNRDIVAAVDILIAAPAENEEQLRSGTWATVRYARAAGKPVIMLSR